MWVSEQDMDKKSLESVVKVFRNKRRPAALCKGIELTKRNQKREWSAGGYFLGVPTSG